MDIASGGRFSRRYLASRRIQRNGYAGLHNGIVDCPSPEYRQVGPMVLPRRWSQQTVQTGLHRLRTERVAETVVAIVREFRPLRPFGPQILRPSGEATDKPKVMSGPRTCGPPRMPIADFGFSRVGFERAVEYREGAIRKASLPSGPLESRLGPEGGVQEDLSQILRRSGCQEVHHLGHAFRIEPLFIEELLDTSVAREPKNSSPSISCFD